jgi:tetratricopeptide (TPR) repeat protein
MKRIVTSVVVITAVAATTGALVVAGSIGLGNRPAPSGDAGAAVAGEVTGADLPAGIARLQSHLKNQPQDAHGWAVLGSAYVEQARRSGDPTYYPKADGALKRSLQEQPDANDAALAGQGALSAARHDFAAALHWADRSLAVNPYGAQALSVRTDALTELGRYDEAQAAAEHADATRPGADTFARLSYQAELRGDVKEASRLMQLVVDSSDSPADTAFATFHLGELARTSGDHPGADRAYTAALAADPSYVPALAGQARLAAARGDLALAAEGFEDVARRLPSVDYVVALGEIYQAQGDSVRARQQYDVAGAAARLAEANGVRTDLEVALFQADHGNPAAAVRAARTEWSRRHSVHVADALGWSLHMAGDDRAALPFVRAATALGTKDSRFLFHRGVIEAGLGLTTEARRSLQSALDLDLHFDPLRAPAAVRLLADLKGA